MSQKKKVVIPVHHVGPKSTMDERLHFEVMKEEGHISVEKVQHSEDGRIGLAIRQRGEQVILEEPALVRALIKVLREAACLWERGEL